MTRKDLLCAGTGTEGQSLFGKDSKGTRFGIIEQRQHTFLSLRGAEPEPLQHKTNPLSLIHADNSTMTF